MQIKIDTSIVKSFNQSQASTQYYTAQPQLVYLCDCYASFILSAILVKRLQDYSPSLQSIHHKLLINYSAMIHTQWACHGCNQHHGTSHHPETVRPDLANQENKKKEQVEVKSYAVQIVKNSQAVLRSLTIRLRTSQPCK